MSEYRVVQDAEDDRHDNHERDQGHVLTAQERRRTRSNGVADLGHSRVPRVLPYDSPSHERREHQRGAAGA